MRFKNHKEKWIDCERCSLGETCTKVVLLRGRIPCNVLVIGEAPGVGEDVTGQPLTGPSGRFLDRILEQACYDVEKEITFAYTNLIGCIPLEDGEKMLEPPQFAVDSCSSRVTEVIAMCKPKLIVCAGKGVFENLTLPKSCKNVSVLAITHPAHIMRLQSPMKEHILESTLEELSKAFSKFP